MLNRHRAHGWLKRFRNWFIKTRDDEAGGAHEPRNTLAWSASPTREVLRLSGPIAVSTVAYSLMTLADTFFVSGLGSAALSGVGLGGIAAFTLTCFGMGVLRATNALSSQAHGAGAQHRIAPLVCTALVMGLGLSALTLSAVWPVRLVLPMWSATNEAALASDAYFTVRMLSVPLVFAAVVLRQARYGVGDSHAPMIAAVVGNALNIVLDAWFILGLDLGVAGAAWATFIATAAELVLLWRVHVITGLKWVRPRRDCARDLIRLGVPLGFSFVLEVGAFALLGIMISRLSELEMAAHQIALQVSHFAFLPAFALAEAGAVLAGQAVGADRDELVVPVALRAGGLGTIYTVLCSLAFWLFADVIVAPFAREPHLASASALLLRIAGGFLLFDAMAMTSRGVLRGTGDVKFAATLGVILAWLLTPPLMWGLGYKMGLGAAGGWLGLVLETVLGAGILWRRLLRHGFARAAMLSRESLQEAQKQMEDVGLEVA